MMKHSAAEPQPKLRMTLNGLIEKTWFTAEAQRTQRERRGLTNASVTLCATSAFSAPPR
jgi:hypothetical protein